MHQFLFIAFIGNLIFFFLSLQIIIFNSCLSYALFVSTGRWFVSMNFCVHSLMYSYFALRAARIRVPQFIQQFITFFQIVQMVAGCIVNVAAFNYKQKGYSCATSNTNIVVSLALYASYFSLFAHFFYMTYLRKDSKRIIKSRID
jgi:elongation of very long chain fatty acids protein 6